MGSVELILILLFVSVAGLNALAHWLSVPFPILLVLGGLALGLVPGVPKVELDPDLVLILFLPPLLYSAAFFTDLRSLRDNARPLSMSAIGLVLLTIVVVAVIAHEVIGMTWAVAFALGAIVSPTDPVAATAIMRRSDAGSRTRPPRSRSRCSPATPPTCRPASSASRGCWRRSPPASTSVGGLPS
jgi:NhaP-type Na+/H+ or K+/H+ antiporter